MSSIRSRFRKSLLACSGLSGIATVPLGLVVIVGWHLGNRTLIQVLPQFGPMQYNTALGFVFSGLALTILVADRPSIGVAFGAVAALIGGLTLVEYGGDVSLGIDQLFMEHDITTMTYASRNSVLITAFAMTCPTRSGTPWYD